MVPYLPDFIQNFDVTVLNGIHEFFTCDFLDFIMPKITFLGDKGWIWIVLAVALLPFKKTRKTGLMMGVALILGLIFGNGLLKNLFGRVRPYELEGALVTNPLIEKPHDYSFPSGHTLASFEAAAVVFIRCNKLPGKALFGMLVTILAAFIAFSRLYLYVHFPSDIIGGIILGVFFGFCGAWIINGIEKALNKGKLK
ncbi:MAG: phosphatase PAP2 family protein [Clostridia bacterium]|nr:phosphatase PAP2 family protein [Clostridia bacterium]